MKLDYSRHYRRWHSDSPEQEAALLRHYSRVLNGMLPADKSARIVDVGCGMGRALLALKSLGYSNLCGLEYDEGQAAYCRSKGLEVELTQDTPGALRRRVQSFDLVLCMDVLEHIPHDAQLDFVTAIHEALKPGGKLICTVPNANSALAMHWRYIDWTHHDSFTESSLDFLLYNGGFKDISIGPVEFLTRPKWWWLPIGGSRHWWLFRLVRLWQRLVFMAELGPQAGRTVPLSLNLLGQATKAR